VAFGLPETVDLRIASPSWSADGRRLAWVVGGTFEDGWRIGLAVFDLQAQSSELFHLYEPVGVGGWPDAPVWSPDGQWLAYVVWPVADPAQGGLWVMRPNGEAERRLGQGSGPVWSPDGRWLVYTEGLGDGETDVWMVEAGVWEPAPLELPAGAVIQAWTPGT
jgi:Tol biopolymer transport system component